MMIISTPSKDRRPTEKKILTAHMTTAVNLIDPPQAAWARFSPDIGVTVLLLLTHCILAVLRVDFSLVVSATLPLMPGYMVDKARLFPTLLALTAHHGFVNPIFMHLSMGTIGI